MFVSRTLTAALLGLTLFALSLASPAQADPATTVTLYSGQHQQTVRLLVQAFEKQTGIQVKVRSGGESELAFQIVREGKRTPADVFFTENSPPLIHLQAKGLLAKLQPKTLHQIPAQYRSDTGHWVGVAARENVMTYNPKRVEQSALPSSILGFAEPQWKGKIGLHLTSTDVMPVVRAIRIQYGKAKALAWLKAIKNNAKLYQSSSGVVNAVNQGDLAVGISNSYYYYRLREQVGKDKMLSRVQHFAAGDPGGMVNVSGAAVLKYAKHPQAARQLVAFLVSQKAQQLIGQGSIDFEYPLHKGVPASPQLKPLDELQPPAITFQQLGDNTATLQLMQQVGLM